MKSVLAQFGPVSLAAMLAACGGGSTENSSALQSSTASQGLTIAAVTPTTGTLNFSSSATIKLMASTALDASTVNSNSVQLTYRDGSGASVKVTAQIAYNAEEKAIEITPTSALVAGRTYAVLIRGGTGGVKSQSGTAMTSDYNLTLTTAASNTPPSTGDTVAPTVESVSPAKGALNVALNSAITIKMSEQVQSQSVSGTTVFLEKTGGAKIPAT